MNDRDRIKAALSAFDGRATTLLTELAVREANGPAYIDHLVALIADKDGAVSGGASWLLKAHLEAEGELTANQTGRMIEQLERVTGWACTLHTCQIVRLLTIDAAEGATRLAGWLEDQLDHERPFIRAWSADGLVALAKRHKHLEGPARKALARARDDAAASVRARARNLTLN